jgi:hypothetical protein
MLTGSGIRVIHRILQEESGYLDLTGRGQYLSSSIACACGL